MLATETCLAAAIGRCYVLPMTCERVPADSRVTTTIFRARWFWVLLLCVAAALFFWPRRIRIPLSDGTTLEISEITTGKKHSHSRPLTWRNVQFQIAFRRWQWPKEAVEYQKPGTVFWFDDPTVYDKYRLVLVDRNGWRWSGPRSKAGNCTMRFPPIESDGPLRIEILDPEAQERLGAATMPVAGVAPETSRLPSIEPAPFPVQHVEGLLSATIHSVDVRVTEGVRPRAKVRVRLDTLWNGQPFTPEHVRVGITDSLGRQDWQRLDPQGEFVTFLSPHGTVWDIALAIFRGPGVPLEPDETVSFEPVFSKGSPVATWDGSVRGIGWRVIAASPGDIQAPFRYAPIPLTLDENVPVIAVEVQSDRNVKVRIEPLDRDGKLLPVEHIKPRPFVPHVQLVRCPAFDPAEGHTIRVGFDVARHVNFAVRPQGLKADSAQ